MIDLLRFKKLTVLWILFLCLNIGLSVKYLKQDTYIETQLSSLLPKQERDPIKQQFLKNYDNACSSLLVLLFTHKDPQVLTQIRQDIDDKWTQEANYLHDFLQPMLPDETQKTTALMSQYFAHRYFLLPQAKEHAEQPEAFFNERIKEIQSPLFSLSTQMLGQDPLMLQSIYVESLVPQSKYQVQGRFLVSFSKQQSQAVAILPFLLKPEHIKKSSQLVLQNMDTWIEHVRSDITTRYPQARVMASGSPIIAYHIQNNMQRELSWLSMASMALILAVMFFTFRSVQELIMAALAIFLGGMVALNACVLVFGRVHAMTLVFGASLMGVAIDYAFHYLCEYHASLDLPLRTGSFLVLKRVFPAIFVGMLTTILGELGLLFTPLPGLRQMGVFSIVGVLSAFVCVVLFFPYVMNKKHVHLRSSWLLLIAQKTLRFSRACMRYRKTVYGVVVLLSLVGFICLWHMRSRDDVRLLSSIPKAYDPESFGIDLDETSLFSSQFLLIKDEQLQGLLEKQEQLHHVLSTWKTQGLIGDFKSLAPFFPSKKQQQFNFEHLQTLINSPAFEHYVENVGFVDSAKDLRKNLLLQVKQAVFFDPSVVNKKDLPFSLQLLWGEKIDNTYASAIMIQGLKDAKLLEPIQTPNVQWVDQVHEISSLLGRYRYYCLWMIVASYLCVWLFLCVRYGLRSGLFIIYPPILASLLTFSVLFFLDFPLTLFHELALLMMLGVGVDYTIFLKEGHDNQEDTMLAILLSFITSVPSFLMLGFCEAPILKAIGLTLFLGVLLSFLLAPLVLLDEPVTK